MFGGLPFGKTMATQGAAPARYKPECAGVYACLAGKRACRRANTAIKMILAGKGLGSRAFDNCFEQFDGEAVHEKIIHRASADLEFARAVLSNERYMAPEWTMAAREMIRRNDA